MSAAGEAKGAAPRPEGGGAARVARDRHSTVVPAVRTAEVEAMSAAGEAKGAAPRPEGAALRESRETDTQRWSLRSGPRRSRR